MNSQTHASVMGNRKNKAVVETVAQIVFTICAFFAVLAVVSITLYMIISGTPAILKLVWERSCSAPNGCRRRQIRNSVFCGLS